MNRPFNTLAGKFLLLCLLALTAHGCEEHYSRKHEIELIPFRNQKTGRWGFLDGKAAIALDTTLVSQPTFFREGYAIFRNVDGTWDYISSAGKVTLARFREATLFSEGLACVVKANHSPSYVNEDFETVYTLDFAAEAGMFSEGMAKFQNFDGRWGFIDKSGAVAVKPAWHYVTSFREGLAMVALKVEDGVYAGFIDKDGKVVMPLSKKYLNLRPFAEGLAAFRSAEGWGFMDNTGFTAIKPHSSWLEVTDFMDGCASFREGSLWGLIDMEGKVVIEPKYSAPLYFYNGLAAAEINGRTGFIDIKERFVITPEYDGVGIPFIAEYAFMLLDNRYVVIDRNGAIVNNDGIYRINTDYRELFDYESTVKSDFFDLNYVDSLIAGRLDSASINGIGMYTSPDSIAARLTAGSGEYRIDSAKGRFSAGKIWNYKNELIINSTINIPGFSTDSAVLRNYRVVTTLRHNAIDKQRYIVGSLWFRLIGSGFGFRADSSRMIFYTDSTAVLLYTYYDDLILDYFFDRKRFLDSNFTELTQVTLRKPTKRRARR